jgi:hypothetical protein
MFSIASISCPATGMGNFPVMNEPGCLLVKKGVVSYRVPHAANQGPQGSGFASASTAKPSEKTETTEGALPTATPRLIL